MRFEPGSFAEIFFVFLRLGLTSFGGPIAHLGYFRGDLVIRRHWIDEAGYAEIVAQSQFLPGPASSKVGFTLGLLRGNGLMGGLAAWLGFTLPSAIALFAFAMTAASVGGPVAEGVVHGLKLVAVAIVAQALWGMSRTLTPDLPRIGIAVIALTLALMVPGSVAQIAAILCGAVLGPMICKVGDTAVGEGRAVYPVTMRSGVIALGLFVLLLVALPIASAMTGSGPVKVFDAFYRSGALVFGGGHVLLPLLESAVVAPGWVSPEAFLTGYGATQAVPGPLFTFSAYLGALVTPAGHPAIGATIALVALFLPGGLLAYGILPFWRKLSSIPRARAAVCGTNAAVVGILAAAFYDPVFTGAILTPLDLLIAIAGFAVLVLGKVPPWVVVVLLAGACGVMGYQF
ncbi:chromate efflux transporter [Falsirhodobacter xinxiangensis]|uniref:chromate efflux transporter n=1 Tax=Falsirhodobacter xinxiangensis TaxID=2530049 RepID=UPI0010AAE2F1|nr:chromate efflux transporter [Rhodobacter xinxiangensis]